MACSVSGAGLGLWPNPRLLAGLQEAAPSSGVGKLPPGRDLCKPLCAAGTWPSRLLRCSQACGSKCGLCSGEPRLQGASMWQCLRAEPWALQISFPSSPAGPRGVSSLPQQSHFLSRSSAHLPVLKLLWAVDTLQGPRLDSLRLLEQLSSQDWREEDGSTGLSFDHLKVGQVLAQAVRCRVPRDAGDGIAVPGGGGLGLVFALTKPLSPPNLFVALRAPGVTISVRSALCWLAGAEVAKAAKSSLTRERPQLKANPVGFSSYRAL